jgi:hypothetical protein
MILLKATTESLQLITAAAATLDYSISYADITTTTFTPSTSEGKVTTATTTTILTAPVAATQRQVKLITISNIGATVSTVLSVNKLISATTYNLTANITLLAGETLQYMDGRGWIYYSVTGSIKGDMTAAGTHAQVQLNNNGILNGDVGLTFDTTNDILALASVNSTINIGSSITSTPALPVTSSLTIFARAIANRQMLAQVGPSGLDTAFQPLMARNKVGYWDPQGNNVTVPGVFGITAPLVSGTATARNVAFTSLATRMRRLGYVSSTTAGNPAGQYINVAQFTGGSGVNDGSGFFYVCRFVPSSAATVAGMTMFVGMSSSVGAPLGNTSPETLTNQIGFGQKSSDTTQLYFFYGGSTAQTSIGLGAANFPGQTLSTTAYEVAIFAPNSIASIYYVQCTNLTNGAVYTNTVSGASTIVPQSTTGLTHRAYVGNNATALAAGIDICSVYIETDT